MGLMRARQQICRMARGVSRLRRRLVLCALCAVAVVSAGARSAAGQDAASPRDLAPARCDYRTCALLIAPGAEPVLLEIPGAAAIPIHYLRSFTDSRAIVARIPSSSS